MPSAIDELVFTDSCLVWLQNTVNAGILHIGGVIWPRDRDIITACEYGDALPRVKHGTFHNSLEHHIFSGSQMNLRPLSFSNLCEQDALGAIQQSHAWRESSI